MPKSDPAKKVGTTDDSPKGRTISFTVPPLPRPKRPQASSGGRFKAGAVALLVLAAALLGGLGGGYIATLQQDGGVISSTLNGEKKIVTEESQRINEIVKAVGPSVVSVNVSISSDGGGDFFGLPTGREAEAVGSGVILNKDGLVMTNRHVVPAGTTDVSLTLSDGTELEDVQILGRTSPNDTLDIAFLKINNTRGKTLKPAVLGDSSLVQVGDDVIAIGNALGQFENTVTSGIISGFGRSVRAAGEGTAPESLENLFQTDTAINQGNSGGPLMNLNGQVIGVNTAVAGGGAENIGFAIPINDIKGLIDQVVKTGKLERPYLGVRYIPLTADIAEAYDLPINRGAFIVPSLEAGTSSVLNGGPADKAGLRERDIITEVEGRKIDQNRSLTGLLGRYAPGETVTLTILRDGETRKVDVTLEALPQQNQ